MLCMETKKTQLHFANSKNKMLTLEERFLMSINPCSEGSAQRNVLLVKQHTVHFKIPHVGCFFYKTTCHIILHLSASKSESTVKENLDRLFPCVFKFYEADAIVLPRFHAMNFARPGNGVTTVGK